MAWVRVTDETSVSVSQVKFKRLDNPQTQVFSLLSDDWIARPSCSSILASLGLPWLR